MRIEQLEYVAAVTVHGSLRRASEQLHISQPALSEAVSKLEKELGVTLLDRRRSGARISRAGRDLLQNISDVLDSVSRLRSAAGDHKAGSRLIRIGTVNAATSTLVVPALRTMQDSYPTTAVEVLDAPQADIVTGLDEGSLDLGLINCFDSDDDPVGLGSITLLHGQPVAVLPAGHRLAARPEIGVSDLRAERYVSMRSGYLMHRFAHRLFGTDLPETCHSTGGAEMGKLMVSEGLGLTILPDYSVHGDPLERAGLIVARPIADDVTRLSLRLLHRPSAQMPDQVAALVSALGQHARSYRRSRAS